MYIHPRAAPSLVGRLRELAADAPDRPVCTFLPRGEGEGITWSFAQLDAQARRIATRLHEHPATGVRVLLVHPPGLEFLAAFVGCLYAGAVAVPVPFAGRGGSTELLARLAEDCDAAVALTTPGILERFRRGIRGHSPLNRLRWIDGPDEDGTSSEIDAGLDLGTDPDPSALAYLQYTSGSTGTPRGVMVSHRNLAHNLRAISHGAGSRTDTVAVCWLPLFHDMGLVGCLEVASAGGHTVLMPPLHALQRPRRWLHAMTRYRASRSGAPNFFYDLCVRTVSDQDRAGLDLRCWDVAVNGGEPVRAETIDRFVEAFGPVGFRRSAFRPSYGLAESTVYVAGAPARTEPVTQAYDAASLTRGLAIPVPPDTPCSRTLVGCGHPHSDQEVVIADPVSGAGVQPEGHIGEIWTRGDSVAQGYWGRPQDTEEIFGATLPNQAPRYLRTGDLGFILNGELFVTGRLKDLIIIRGTNHAPEDIERTAGAAHRALAGERSAALSMEIDGEEQLVIVHELRRRPPGEAQVTEIWSRVCEAVIAEHGIRPARIVLTGRGTIPRTTSGKVRRQACRELLHTGAIEGFHDD